jgi:hypothetical protein
VVGAAVTLPATGFWPELFAMIDRHPAERGLRFHGLAPLAVAHWRDVGRPIPSTVASAQAEQAALALEAERLVRHSRGVIDGPLMLIKGLEVAARYPDPTLRALRDVDLLVPDALSAQDALLAAGYLKQKGAGIALHPRSYDDLHQLCPLEYPGMSLPIEMHRHPHWPTWARPPTFDELYECAVPSRLCIDDLVVPGVEHHALLVLAHSWARQPFEQLSQLVDFALLVEECDRSELRRIATRWRLDRLLGVADRAVESLLLSRGQDPLVMRWFAPHLRSLSVASHARRQVNRYLGSVAVIPFGSAVRAAGQGVARRVRVLALEARARAAREE